MGSSPRTKAKSKILSSLDLPRKTPRKETTVTFRIEANLKKVLTSNHINISQICRDHLRNIAEKLESP